MPAPMRVRVDHVNIWLHTWLLRVVWATLPVTAGWAAADAMRPWSSATRTTTEVMLWTLWVLVLLATLVPRPVSLTAARIGAPLAFVAALLAAATGRPAAAAGAVAVAATTASVLLAGLGSFSRACAQGAAYGDEERFPLKVPPTLFLAPLPLAVLIIGVGLAAGPLLLSVGRVAAGLVVLLVGVPVAGLLGRSVHQLSRRWVVLVPAGLVVADPMTLTDPVLFLRERILGLGPADSRRRPPPEALDLRLGAATGSLALLLDRDTDLYRRVRARAVGVRAHLLLFACVHARHLLEHAARRRIPVQRSTTASTKSG